MNATAGIELAAFFVTWVALALLALIAAGLHLRVVRLERALSAPAPAENGPFAGLQGRSLRDSLPMPVPRLALLVSSSCSTCRSLIADIATDHWHVPTVVAWKDAVPPDLPHLPASVLSIDGGRAIEAEVGVESEPLALVLDDDGRIVVARPTSSLPTLRALLHGSDGANHHASPTEVHA